MAASSYPIPLDQFPPDLIQAVAQDAAAAAGHVAVFLDTLGLRCTNEGGTPVPLRLPYFFLLGLGAALRLLVWEQHGVQAHREGGVSYLRLLRSHFGYIFRSCLLTPYLCLLKACEDAGIGRVPDAA